MEKYFQTCGLWNQGYVKQNSEISVKEHIANVAKKLNDSITVRRFVRYQIGESISA